MSLVIYWCVPCSFVPITTHCLPITHRLHHNFCLLRLSTLAACQLLSIKHRHPHAPPADWEEKEYFWYLHRPLFLTFNNSHVIENKFDLKAKHYFWLQKGDDYMWYQLEINDPKAVHTTLSKENLMDLKNIKWNLCMQLSKMLPTNFKHRHL